MPRFSAKILFQFRPAARSSRAQMRLCEERIVRFDAASARGALAKAKEIARRASFTYRATDGGRVRFEPLGILELMELGVETVAGEVWWELCRRKVPGRGRPRSVPPERNLRVFTDLRPSDRRSDGRRAGKARRLTSA